MANPTEALVNAYDGVDEAMNMIEQVPDPDGIDGRELDWIYGVLEPVRARIATLIDKRKERDKEQGPET